MEYKIKKNSEGWNEIEEEEGTISGNANTAQITVENGLVENRNNTSYEHIKSQLEWSTKQLDRIDSRSQIGCIDKDFQERVDDCITAAKRLKEDAKKETGVKYSKGKLPMYNVLFKQFPNALREVVECSRAGHEKYKETDGDWKNFKRVENAIEEYLNAGVRHLGKEGINEDMLDYGETLHEAQAVWNFLAALEIKLTKGNSILS